MKRPKIRQLLKFAAKRYSCRTRDLKGRSRSAILMDARKFFTAIGEYFQYRQYEIAWALDRSENTVSYYSTFSSQFEISQELLNRINKENAIDTKTEEEV